MLLGKNGQVGSELQKRLALIGELISLGRRDPNGDLTIINSTANRILDEQPDVVVNAAAYTAVDKAENEIDICRRINSIAVEEIAEACKTANSLLVHYSSDYVFNGEGNHFWKENDQTGPLNVYGATKLEGENAIKKIGCKHIVFRTSWVYGLNGKNFPSTIINLAQEKKELKIINDQYGVPTGADLIADISARAIVSAKKTELSGVYHLVPSGTTTWYEYAKKCIEIAQNKELKMSMTSSDVEPVSTADYQSAAKRPKNSRLHTSKIERELRIKLPSWEIGVEKYISSILNK